jgi:hypothetical protein
MIIQPEKRLLKIEKIKQVLKLYEEGKSTRQICLRLSTTIYDSLKKKAARFSPQMNFFPKSSSRI